MESGNERKRTIFHWSFFIFHLSFFKVHRSLTAAHCLLPTARVHCTLLTAPLLHPCKIDEASLGVS